MRPTLRQLEYLVTVADTGHIGRAAAQLNVSQPSLSVQLNQVEADLGVILFDRGRQGTHVTREGAEIIRRARLILRDVQDLRAVAKDGGPFGGRLRLGVVSSIGPYLLPDVVRRLHSDYPDLRLVIREENTQELQEGLRSGRLDLAISTPEDHPNMQCTALFKEHLWIAVALDDPLSRSSGPVPLSALSQRIFLTLGPQYRLSHIVAQLANQTAGYVSDEYEGTSLDAIRLMAAAGAGIAVLPQIYAMTEARRATDVVLRPLAEPGARRDIALIQPAGRAAHPGGATLANVVTAEAHRLLHP